MSIQSESMPVACEQPTHAAQKPQEFPASSPLECNICYEESNEPVSTHCGHIYCWSCIYKWISTKSSNGNCPVCKNLVSEEKIIPLYPKNYDDEKKIKTSEDGVPKRPIAKREEKPAYTGFGHSLFTGVNIRGSNFAMTIGCLPAFLPLLIMIFFSCFTMFADDDDEGTSTNTLSGEERESEYINGGIYETDEFDWMVIVIMIAFVCLPFILGRFRRRN